MPCWGRRADGQKMRRVREVLCHAREEIEAILGLSGRWLEIGSGPGSLAAMIAEEHSRVDITAVDISPDMVGLASDFVRERGLEDRV